METMLSGTQKRPEGIGRIKQLKIIEICVQCFVDAENVLTEECPTLFLYANENITLINTDKVKMWRYSRSITIC